MKFVLALCLLGLAFGQLEESFDCNTLQIETDLDTPITGANLKYCKVDTLQCCDNAYLTKRREEVLSSVKEDIKDQIENQLERFGYIVDGIENNIRKNFIPKFSENYCGPIEKSVCTRIVQGPLNRFISHLIIDDDDDDDDDDDHESTKTGGDTTETDGETTETDGDTTETDGETSETDGETSETDGDTTETNGDTADGDTPTDADGDDTTDTNNDKFSVEQVVNEFVNSTLEGIFKYFVKTRRDSLPDGAERCVKNAIQVQQAQFVNIERNLTQIRLAISALERLRTYVKDTALSRFLAVPPTNSCIDAFINTRCQSCVRDIPDNCRGACNALVFGCYVPYAVGLKNQFDLLWSSTNQIVDIINGILRVTGGLPQKLFNVDISDATELTNLLNARCNLDLPEPTDPPTTATEGDTTNDDTETGGTTLKQETTNDEDSTAASDGTEDDSESTKPSDSDSDGPTDDDSDSESTKPDSDGPTDDADSDSETTGGDSDDDSETTGGDSDDDDDDSESTRTGGDEYKLPSAVSTNSTRLLNSGVFGSEVPETCEDYVNTDCWNGTHSVAVNNVNINIDSIDELANSPFAAYYDTSEIEASSESFEPLISNFLKSDSFQTVAPAGLVVEDTSGSSTVLVNYLVMLVITCVAIFSVVLM